MRVVVQERFAEPEDAHALADEPLIIHRRQHPSANRHLVIFVHGLGGSRYGANSTWGHFPRFLYEDFESLDIGLYAYRTAFGRLRFTRSIPVPREADVFADQLRTVRKEGPYDWISLVGHSLGGLLCKGAVVSLNERNHRKALERISTLTLMATPQLGSIRVGGFVRWLTRDFHVLRAHSDFVGKLTRAFQARFHCAIAPPDDDRVHLPVWAVVGATDFWVDTLSAGIGIEQDQQLTVREGHQKVVKPRDKQADSYTFVKHCIEYALQPRALPFRDDNCRPMQQNELGFLREFAVRLFGDGVTPLDIMNAWWNANPHVFQVVERITKSGGRLRKELVGYFAVYPLSAEAVRQLKSGELTGPAITPAHLPAPGEPPAAAYVGAVAGTDGVSKAAAINFLKMHLQEMSGRKPLVVLTRPVTEDGLHLVNGHAFQPVAPTSKGPLGVLHESTVTGFGRHVRGRPRRRQSKAKES